MGRFPRRARLARLKCIPCNAPTTRTINENFVCVNCGETIVSLEESMAIPRADAEQNRPDSGSDAS